jgi:hypothetical protein
VVEAVPATDGGGKTAYKLTTTVLLTMAVERAESTGSVDLSGSLTRQATGVYPVNGADKTHVTNMGAMIEAMEADMRSAMDALYIAKTREIVSALHGPSGAGNVSASRAFVSDLASAVKKHGHG